MSEFEAETAVESTGDGRWTTRLHAGWNIADNSNGGYALTPVLRAMRSLVDHPDPISVTTHFLRPSRGDTDAEVTASVIRSGRSVSTLRGALWQQGTQRLEVLAAFADMAASGSGGVVGSGHAGGTETGGVAGSPERPEICEAPPVIPSPAECVKRDSLEQGVELPILSRVDVCVHPDHAPAGQSDRALIDGWIRFSDGTPPSTLALPFYADALPPSLYPLMGFVGWVPTIELTVHPRRVPQPGWLQVRQESHDLHDGRMIESGTIWDSSGVVVATARQVGLLLTG